jgi:hypothetical protein
LGVPVVVGGSVEVVVVVVVSGTAVVVVVSGTVVVVVASVVVLVVVASVVVNASSRKRYVSSGEWLMQNPNK